MRAKINLTTVWAAVAICGQRVVNHEGPPIALTYDSSNLTPQIMLAKGESHEVVGSGTLYARITQSNHVTYVSLQDNVDLTGVALSKLIDEASATVTYICEALPGTALTTAAWRMQRLTVSGSTTRVEWFDGGKFSGQASLRASVGYA